MSNLIRKIKKEMDIVGKDVFKEAVAECINQRGEWQLQERLRDYADVSTQPYINAFHVWSASRRGRDFWEELNYKVCASN
jgi:hypothetical protein